MLNNIVMFAVVCAAVTYFTKKFLSKEPNNVKFQSYFMLYYFLTSVVCFVVWPLFLFNPRNVKNSMLTTKILKYITKLLDVKWELRNGHILAEDRGAVIVSNHQSSLDVLGLFNIWETIGKMTVIAKKEVFYVWPLGLAAYLGGVIFINRGNPKVAYKELETETAVMINQKTKILFYPEGTRNKNNSKLLPFKKGAFVIAVNAQVPIIPMLFSPYYFINREKYIFNKGHVIVNCLEPIPTKGLTLDDVPDLISRVSDLMQKEYAKLSKEVFSVLPKDYPLSAKG